MTDPTEPALTRRDTRTLTLAALGGALEFYDFIIFVFFTAVIAKLFFPPDMPEWLRQLQTFGIFAAGYLARPLGGIVMAHFGDRVGRKRMFMLSVLLMAVPTLLMGLLPTYASLGIAAPILLLLLRVLQGAAVGGEVPGAWVFVSEHVPPSRSGFACGTLTSGLTFGILLGSLVASWINSSWTADEVLAWAWRLPFVLGGLFGLLAVWLRRYLEETPVFEEMRRRRELVRGLPLKVVLQGHGGAVIRSMLITWMLTAGIVVVILMTPTLVQSLFAIPPATAATASSLATFALCVGCVLFGIAVDRFGVERVLVIGAVGLVAATAGLYRTLSAAPEYFTTAYTLTGLFVGVTGAIPSLMVRAFPPAIRFSGISFAYNVAYAILGGLTPLVVSLWIRAGEPNAPVYYVGLACLAGASAAIWAAAKSRTSAMVN
ncbi:MFS transporter [Dokdonella sp.]|uniref:MFS transporter n=1 Tax=Dokdonella sp. TaxID=2291710 RepID=UPI002CC6B34F|nr:MFS transporter [Dokdonella sp.]HOX72530.1 MFS transporter [Dokdonella sp.]HPN80857.1 MFS transporter [Dokdonella sp.]